MILLFLACIPSRVDAEVKVGPLFSRFAVLQKSPNTAVFGTAEPGEHVAVRLENVTATTTAGTDRKWRVDLDLSRCSAGPFVLEIQGNNLIRIPDIAVGEVWLCSGQSNMEFRLDKTLNPEAEISRSDRRLRQFFVEPKPEPKPLENCQGKWLPASPSTSGGFTAVGYFFAGAIEDNLHTPVGIINSSVGNTPIESWMSEAALAQDPELKEGAARQAEAASTYPERKQTYELAMVAWEEKTNRGDRTPQKEFSLLPDETKWKPISLPNKLSAAGLADTGAVWLVRKLKMPSSSVGKRFVIPLGVPNGLEAVYWNGELIGSRTWKDFKGEGEGRNYAIPAEKVTREENLLAVRLFNSRGELGIEKIADLGGKWLARVEFELTPASPEQLAALPPPLQSAPSGKKMASYLYNGMIHPLSPFTIRGVIWYQGESNVERACQYQRAFPLLITSWRKLWGQGDFPFYYCQLANYRTKAKEPSEADWAELREAQDKALSILNTGQAVLIDIGETWDIHPRNKKEVGARLAALALSKTYQIKVPCTGPRFESLNVDGAKARVQFKTSSALLAKPLPDLDIVSTTSMKSEPLIRYSPEGPLEGFAICGMDRKWFWADAASIDGTSVIVTSRKVPAPVAVRYAWGKNPTCNLYSAEGFPAAPFRTDNFPGVTDAAKFGFPRSDQVTPAE